MLSVSSLVSLCWSLWRSRTGFRKTDSLLYRVMRGAVQTGLFVTVFALGDMFSFHFNPETNLYAMFAFPIGRIYSNVRLLLPLEFNLTMTSGSLCIQTLLDTLLSRHDMKATISSGHHDVEVRFLSPRPTLQLTFDLFVTPPLFVLTLKNELQNSIRLGHVDVNISREVRVQRDFASHTMDGSDRDAKGMPMSGDETSSADRKAVAF